MTNRNDIQSELREISEVVSGISFTNPFKVPELYFDGFPAIILNRIRVEEASSNLQPSWIKPEPANPFSVPQGYFDSLSATIMTGLNSEDGELSPKQELEQLSPLLGSMSRQVPFAMPAEYFESLPQDLVAGIKAIDFVHQELETLSPLMNEARTTNAFTVPNGYFDKLPAELLKKIQKPAFARIIGLNLRGRVARFAVAAAVAGAISVGAWLFVQNKPGAPIAGNSLTGIEKVSDQEIQNYLDNNSVVYPEAGSTASADLKEADLKAMFTDIPDDELQTYLDQHAGPSNTTIN